MSVLKNVFSSIMENVEGGSQGRLSPGFWDVLRMSEQRRAILYQLIEKNFNLWAQ